MTGDNDDTVETDSRTDGGTDGGTPVVRVVLGISERTVKAHLGNVFRRISVQDRTSAALWARENLPPTEG
jgi:hypothetical protein